MKKNLELERNDLVIDSDMEVDCDTGHQITVYIETWFDSAEKFAGFVDTSDIDWINMYGKYDPFADTLRIECEANYPDQRIVSFDYQPTEAEAKFIKEMITEKIREVYNQTPQEFCEELSGGEITLGGIQ